MKENEQTVFISYAWGGRSEEIVDQIGASLKTRGIKLVRDKQDMSYKDSIRAFMQRIGQGSCVIVVISDKYLRSPNCMFELVEIADNKQFHDRIFPIVLTDAGIYDPVKGLRYVKYWEDQRKKLAKAMKTVDPANLQGIREDIDLYDRIRDKVSGLVSILKDMNTLTPEMHKDSNFDQLYKALEKRLEENPLAPEADAKASALPSGDSSQPGRTAAAANGGIAVGNIQIGGNMNGNMIFGNNNQIDSEG
jgi:hypothetical protein